MNNVGAEIGGVIRTMPRCTINNTDTLYHNNASPRHGGALFMGPYGRMNNLRTTLTNNTGDWGGALFMWWESKLSNIKTVWR